jgi:hypothetical protein
VTSDEFFALWLHLKANVFLLGLDCLLLLRRLAYYIIGRAKMPAI